MPEYVSIRDDVVKKLEEHLPEIRERFGIETLGLFGSVSRGEDTAESDIDILYRFKPGIKTYHAMLDLADYLEELFGRSGDTSLSVKYRLPSINGRCSRIIVPIFLLHSFIV